MSGGAVGDDLDSDARRGVSSLPRACVGAIFNKGRRLWRPTTPPWTLRSERERAMRFAYEPPAEVGAGHEFGPVRVQSFHALEEATEAWRAYGDSPLAGARRLRRVLTGYRHGDVAGDRA